MLLGPTVRAVVDFVSMPPRNAIRASAPAVTVNRPVANKQAAPQQSGTPVGLQIKLQAIVTGILTTLRPFPEALEALRQHFRQIPDLEIVE